METNFTGKISASLNVKQIEQFCVQHIPGYDVTRFKVLAIRVFAGEEFIITIFAADAFHQPIFGEVSPVKKFKLTNMKPVDIFSIMNDYNFTLFDKESEIEEMIVINK